MCLYKVKSTLARSPPAPPYGQIGKPQMGIAMMIICTMDVSITDECPMMDRGLWPIPSPSMDDDDDDDDEDRGR